MYVIIEGIDGCGKDTQAGLLLGRLRQEDEADPLLVAEPDSDIVAGALLRQLLRSGEYPEAHAGLFLANRTALQTRVVKPALEEDRTVVSIRSFVSTLVYQQEHWPLDWLFAIHRQMPVRPNLILLLDLPAETGLERASKRPGHTEHYERLDTLKRVRFRYRDLVINDIHDRLLSGPKLTDFMAPGGIIRMVDASRSVEDVARDVWIAVKDARAAETNHQH